MTDPTTFRALVLDQRDGQTVADLTQLTDADLPPEQVLVAVDYSSLNYKDGLAVTGKGKIVRRFPLVPGIDLAGTVLESASSAYRSGDRVVLTGWGVGESFWGGYAQRARVKAEWLTPLPDSLGTRQAMAIGTAGFTAMDCVTKVDGLTSTGSYNIRCAAAFVREGFANPTKYTTAFDSLKGSSGTSGFMGLITFSSAKSIATDTANANTTFNDCFKAGAKGKTLISSFGYLSKSLCADLKMFATGQSWNKRVRIKYGHLDKPFWGRPRAILIGLPHLSRFWCGENRVMQIVSEMSNRIKSIGSG